MAPALCREHFRFSVPFCGVAGAMAGITGRDLVVIIVSVVLPLAVVCCTLSVLCNRRRFQRQPTGVDDYEVAAAAAAAASRGDAWSVTASKELLLYFICMGSQSKNERVSATVNPISVFSPPTPGFFPPSGMASIPGAKLFLPSAPPPLSPMPPPSAPPPLSPMPPPSAPPPLSPMPPPSAPPPLFPMPPPSAPPPLSPMPPPLPAELGECGFSYAPQVVYTTSPGGMEPVVLEAEAVISAWETEDEDERATAGEGAWEVMPSSTPGCSSRFFTPSMSMSPERVVSVDGAVEGNKKEELAKDVTSEPPTTLDSSSRFYTPSMSPLRAARSPWEFELWLEADGSDGGESLSPDGKLYQLSTTTR